MGEEAAQQRAAAGETHIARVTARSRGFSSDGRNFSSERHVWENKLEMFPTSHNKKEAFGFSHIRYPQPVPCNPQPCVCHGHIASSPVGPTLHHSSLLETSSLLLKLHQKVALP